MSPIQSPRRTPGTFLYSEPVSSLDDLAADIAFLGVPYAQAYSYEDITNDQSNGPTAMREASIRIIRSIERYDPEKGATLEQYAWTRVHGAVLDELRRHDWAPRSLRRDERTINEARELFASLHEREPSREELAAQVGMTALELTNRLDQVALAEVGSLNRIVRSDESATIERIDTIESADEECDPMLSAERAEAKARFRRAFARLSRQEREVAVLLYVEGWTLRAIGERLGVSESRISQIHTQLRRRLYEQLAGELPLFAAVG